MGQIVEISNSGLLLRKYRGFLTVHTKQQEIGKVPLDDILTLIVSKPGCTISTSLIDQLCNRNVPIVICGENYLPSSVILPASGNGRQFQIMNSQTRLTLPQRKRTWQTIVRAKISNQARVLEQVGQNSVQLKRLVKQVKSGDTNNCEAQAARAYWLKLFGTKFRRKKKSIGLNSALNYAYTLLRGCIARGVVGSGLHPTFSLHHKNPRNPLNLVDDLMEPLRPVADYLIWSIGVHNFDKLGPQNKSKLVSLVNVSVPLVDNGEFVGSSPLSFAAVKICRSFASFCLGEKTGILTPEIPTAIEIGSICE